MLGQKQRGGLMPSTSAWLCPSELHPVPQDGPAHPQHDEAGTAEQQGAGHPFPACHCSHTRLMGSCHRPGCSQGAADLGVRSLFIAVRGLCGPRRSTWGAGGVCGRWCLCQPVEDQTRVPGSEAPPAFCSSDGLPQAPDGVAHSLV